MATWFARTNFGNINAANMWNSNPAGGGTVLTWPPALGDVLVANGLTVTVNVSVDLGATGELRNDTFGGATNSGDFRPANGTSITANLYGTSTGYLIYGNHTGTVSIVGNVFSQGIGTVIRNQSTGTINFTGSLFTGSGNVQTILNVSTGIINITGNLTSSGSSGSAISNNGAGTINITGTVTASGSSTHAALLGNAGTINLTGNLIQQGSGRGAYIALTAATVTISGYVQAGNNAPGAENVAQGILQVGETRSASNGRPAVAGAFRYASATAAKDMPYTQDGQISMTVLDVAAIVPAESDVRKGLIYGDGAYTGALQLGRNRTSMAGRF